MQLKLFLALLFLYSCSTTNHKCQEIKKETTLEIPGAEIVIQPVEEKPIVDNTVKITYSSKLPYIAKVAEGANCVIRKKSFQDEVKSIKSFNGTNDNGEQVLAKLLSKSCNITTYSKRFSKVLATTWSSDRENVYFNTRNNPRSVPEMINTAVHECLHLSNYSHATNKPSKANETSVPYLVGDIAEKHSEGCY